MIKSKHISILNNIHPKPYNKPLIHSNYVTTNTNTPNRLKIHFGAKLPTFKTFPRLIHSQNSHLFINLNSTNVRLHYICSRKHEEIHKSDYRSQIFGANPKKIYIYKFFANVHL